MQKTLGTVEVRRMSAPCRLPPHCGDVWSDTDRMSDWFNCFTLSKTLCTQWWHMTWLPAGIASYNASTTFKSRIFIQRSHAGQFNKTSVQCFIRRWPRGLKWHVVVHYMYSSSSLRVLPEMKTTPVAVKRESSRHAPSPARPPPDGQYTHPLPLLLCVVI